ncbi:MAG TPA: NAD(P)/FAD-dependent oxidoreductase [Candidatus Obscuribacterales bacterium]
MTIDYDLVILGGSAAGRSMAQRAAQRGLRVALVDGWPEVDRLQQTAQGSHAALVQAARLAQQQAQQGWAIAPLLTLRDRQTWGQQPPSRALASLAEMGVDVVPGPAEFRRRPMAVVAGGRALRSRAYSIATGTEDVVPSIPGIDAMPYTTVRSLWQQPLPSTPIHWLIVGHRPQTVELAQALNSLGQSVTLITAPRLLPAEDPQIAALMAAQLEAEGIEIVLGHPEQVDGHAQACRLQVNGQIYKGDRLLVDTQQPQVRSLNLEAVGVQWTQNGIITNSHLRTTHPQIYALGDGLGGYAFPPIAEAEADILLHNLCYPGKRTVPYHQIPITIQTSPTITRIGLTEPQARQRYGDDLWVGINPFPSDADRTIGQTTSLVKVILKPDGQIIGVHSVGNGADVAALAIALQHHHRFQHLALSPSTALGAIAQAWQNHCRERSPWSRLQPTWLALNRAWQQP